jgi:hypothetical protein
MMALPFVVDGFDSAALGLDAPILGPSVGRGGVLCFGEYRARGERNFENDVDVQVVNIAHQQEI